MFLHGCTFPLGGTRISRIWLPSECFSTCSQGPELEARDSCQVVTAKLCKSTLRMAVMRSWDHPFENLAQDEAVLALQVSIGVR